MEFVNILAKKIGIFNSSNTQVNPAIEEKQNNEPFLEISKGNVSGHSIIHKFGNNSDIETSFETVWDEGGLYSYLTEATVLKISSSSTDDDIGGTGALAVEVFGLDGDYLEINETIILTGQVAVNSVNSYLRIYRIIVKTAGSGGTAAGDIYAGTGAITNGVPAVVYAKAVIGNNQTLMALYTIPAGKTGYLIEKYGGTNKDKETTFSFVSRPEGEVFQIKQLDIIYQTQYLHKYSVAEKFIEIRAKVSVTTAKVSAGFVLILVND